MNLDKQVKKISLENQVESNYSQKVAEGIVGKKGEGHPLPNKTSFIVTR